MAKIAVKQIEKASDRPVTLKIPETLHTLLKTSAAAAREGLTDYAVNLIKEALVAQAEPAARVVIKASRGDQATINVPARFVPIIEALVHFLATPNKGKSGRALEAYLYEILADPPEIEK